MNGKIVLVTGAGSGIGQATALAMAEKGARVICADVNEDAARETTRMAVDAAPGGRADAQAVQIDVSDVQAISDMVENIVSEHGRIDVLVNSAGITRQLSLFDVTEADWEQIYAINVKGSFFCLQHTAVQMRSQESGAIVNMASIAGRGYSGTSNVAYSSGKGAIITMTRTAAQQLARYNINVNAICPGITETPMQTDLYGQRAAQRNMSVEAVREEMASSVPIGRLNGPEDIAATAIFLASAEARNITGQAFNVDGGLIMS